MSTRIIAVRVLTNPVKLRHLKPLLGGDCG
jgi:hypothetical protein